MVGNGIVDVFSGGSANVAFLSNGSSGPEIGDSDVNSSAFADKVSGFGGANHSNQKKFIDLVSVTSPAGQIHLPLRSRRWQHQRHAVRLKRSTVVAQINMIGSYTSANFSARADGSGNVEIVDPAVPNGGSVESGPIQTFQRHGLDLPDIAFGAQTTLVYQANAIGTAVTVTDGRHAAAIALLGNYVAGSFVTTADGHGGTLVTQAPQTGQQPLLTHPVPSDLRDRYRNVRLIAPALPGAFSLARLRHRPLMYSLIASASAWIS